MTALRATEVGVKLRGPVLIRETGIHQKISPVEHREVLGLLQPREIAIAANDNSGLHPLRVVGCRYDLDGFRGAVWSGEVMLDPSPETRSHVVHADNLAAPFTPQAVAEDVSSNGYMLADPDTACVEATVSRALDVSARPAVVDV